MATTAEIISIGDELLYGQTLDTNSHWISGKLDEINIKVYQKSTIGDNEDHILKALAEAEQRADIVLITGGLGPTKDDLTKPLLAKYFGVSLVRNDEALDEITNLFTKSNREMRRTNEGQADLPSNAEKISNLIGTAPGMWFHERDTIFISMPGVPYEMKKMMKEIILPRIQERFNKEVIHHHMIKTIGISESKLSGMIEDWELALPKHIKLAYLPTMGQVKLRLTAMGQNLDQLKIDVIAQQDKLVPVISKYIYGYGDDQIEGVIGQMLLKKNQTLSTAESCTGGYLAHMLTSVPGSSQYYQGTIVSYSNNVKIKELNVKATDIDNYGAVSEEVAKAMAEGVRKKLNTDIGISTTGIAGPDGGTEEKPVGTVWIAYSDREKTVAKKYSFSKDRKFNIHWSALAALNLFRLNYLGE
jgi:nicotinamide-nucleotide amidase